MSNQSDLLCFQCGQSISEPPVIQELPGGGNCPGCVERVLAALPPVLPSEFSEELSAEDEQLTEETAKVSGQEGGGQAGPSAYEPPPEPA